MTVYNIFEGDLTGLGAFLGTYTELDKGLGNVRSYFGCVFFQIAESLATNEDIRALLKENKTVMLGTNNDHILYIFRTELDKAPCILTAKS